MGDLVGYARVSTGEQKLDLQLDALKATGCKRWWSDTASGSLKERPELAKAIDYLRSGDTLVVWRLDRLGRSVRHLIDLVGELEKRGIGLRSLQEGIDTTTPGGRLVFHVFSALAQFEREIVIERSPRWCGGGSGTWTSWRSTGNHDTRQALQSAPVARAWGADP